MPHGPYVFIPSINYYAFNGLSVFCIRNTLVQASRFERASVVIGLHGAGLTNSVLLPKRSVLVEIKGAYGRNFDAFMKIIQVCARF